MASESEIDRNTIFEKFASIKRMHNEVGRQQTEDYQKRLQKLKEDESNYMAKILSQQLPSRPQQDISGRAQNSARRDLFLTSKNDAYQSDACIPQQQQQQQHYPSYKSTNRSSSHHHQDSYDNGDHEWNIDDDIQPLNITDNDVLEERPSTRPINDIDSGDSYLTSFHQLLQTHHLQQQQQQQIIAQQEQENMLSTILEVSCEDATPMTSLVDVHQQRLPTSTSPPTPKNPFSKVSDHENEQEDDEEEEEDYRPIAPSFSSLDEMPVSTIFSKNENLKYSEYILQKMQTEVIHHF